MAAAAKHIRQQIREAVVTKLKEITTFSNRVYPYRTMPHTLLPDAVVKTDDDVVIRELTADHKYMRALSLIIETRVKAVADIDDTLDSLCLAIEEKMMADPTFGGLLKSLELSSTKIEMSQESEQPVGLATIEYEAWYRMLRTDADTVVG